MNIFFIILAILVAIPFICLVELFENLFIEIMPKKLKRNYYFREWNKNLFMDAFVAFHLTIFLSAINRRVAAMSKEEIKTYTEALQNLRKIND